MGNRILAKLRNGIAKVESEYWVESEEFLESRERMMEIIK